MNFIIVPVRNGLHLTRDALKDFLAQDIGDVQVLFIDNASTDGTTQWLQTQDVHTIYRNPPASVAASWNLGLRWAFGQGKRTVDHVPADVPERGHFVPSDPMFKERVLSSTQPDYCLVVNNDVRLRPDTYRHLVEDGGGFVTAVGSQDVHCIDPVMKCGKHDAESQTSTAVPVWYPPNPDAKRDHPDFSCYLIRREVYGKVGPFDEDFEGAYAEDSDMHLRMHQAGITAICLDLPFLHYGAQTIALAGEDEARLISEQAGRNRALFKKKHGVEVGSEEYYALFGHGKPTDQR